MFNKLQDGECKNFTPNLLTSNSAIGLLLAATLTATDTVAVLNIIKERQYPKLHSIIFGEGIFNDAVAILLFKAVNNMI